MTSNNRKRFRTLHDITNGKGFGGDNDNAAGSSSSNGNNGSAKIAVQHIPTLDNAKEAAAILSRIHSEFHTLIERRGWNVISITEMCCCGDGVDCLKGRKTKTMPNNVLGFNLTTWRRGKSHEVHLRLRDPRNHSTLLPYEDIAATMCHELAHCVIGPHNASFYKAMERIEEQYAIFLARGVVVDKDGFPVGSSESHILGSSSYGGTSGNKRNPLADRKKALDAAENRQKKAASGLSQGYVLGGNKLRKSLPKDQREAAKVAAERRLLDSQYCLPCNEVIEILGEDSDEEGDGDDDDDDSEVEIVEQPTKHAKRNAEARSKKQKAEWLGSDSDDTDSDLDTKPRAKKKSAALSDNDDDCVIDLTTLDDSFSMSPVATRKSPAKSKRNNRKQKGAGWTCPRCTLCNPSMMLVCDVCRLERPSNKTVLEQAQELTKQDKVDFIKEREVEQSKETFGGFNIYGDKKNPSSTMKHMT